MANWSNPTLTSLYTDFVTEVKNRDVDLALGLDPATTSPTNVPTNAIRWNSANSRWEKYTSGSWGTLTATYALTSLSLTGSITFEGATDDAFETTLTVADPTADRTITLPNVSGTVVTTGDTGSITSTMIADGTIVNADVSASAAIAGTKISPDFGSQNVTTTGTSTAAGFIPSSATVPSNGLYLPAANQLGFSTASTSRLVVDASGNVNIDSGTFYVDAVGNRTGVNNISPGSYNAAADDLVVGLTGDTGVTIASTNQGSIFFADGTTGGAQQAAGYLYYLHSNDSMGFGTANTLRMTLDASGRLLVGTTSMLGTGGADVLYTRDSYVGGIYTGQLGAFDTSAYNNGPIAGVCFGFKYNTAGAFGVTGNIQVLKENATDGNYASAMRFMTRANGADVAERARIDSSGCLLVGTTTDSGGALLQVNGDRIRVATAKTPASATATGTAGEVCWDASYIYVCTATNTWKRAAIATW